MLNIEINQAELHRLAQEIDLDISHVRIESSPAMPKTVDGKQTYGMWYPGGRIVLYLGCELHAASRLRFIVSTINRTLLHELRHEWQAQHWTQKQMEEGFGAYYSGDKAELDAREFADAKSGSFRLVKVKPRVVARSGLARLSHVRTGR